MMKTFDVGTYVMYKNHGICKIDRLEKKCFTGNDEREYYVLSSVYDANLRAYVPVGSDAAQSMRHVLTKEEINKVIDGSGNCETEYEPDRKKRAEDYNAVIKSGDRSSLLLLYKTLALKKEELIAGKKRLTAQDDTALSYAEKIITEEFSFVLGINKNEVVDYIKNRLN